MAQKLNNSELKYCYNGSTEIKKIYYGSSLVWESNKVIFLGTNTSFNLKSYDGYSSFTTDNFFFTTCNSLSITDTLNNVGAETGYSRITHGRVKTYSGGTLGFYNYIGDNDNTLYGSVKAVLVTKPDKLYSLGTGTSFNVSGYTGYHNFTADNFLIKNWTPFSSPYVYNSYRGAEGRWTATDTKSLVKSYNSSTGVLTCYIRDVGSSDTGDSWDRQSSCSVYLTLDRPV